MLEKPYRYHDFHFGHKQIDTCYLRNTDQCKQTDENLHLKGQTEFICGAAFDFKLNLLLVHSTLDFQAISVW